MVYAAADGLEGLGLLQRCAVDLLITDVEMPRLGGRRFAARVRRMSPHLPVLFVSGSNAGDGFEGLGEPWAFLGKPFSFVALLEQVETLLARRGLCGPPVRVAG